MKAMFSAKRVLGLGLVLAALSSAAQAGPPDSSEWFTSSARVTLWPVAESASKIVNFAAPFCPSGQDLLLLGINGTQDVIGSKTTVPSPYPAWAVSVPTLQRRPDSATAVSFVARSAAGEDIARQLPGGQWVIPNYDPAVDDFPVIGVRIALLGSATRSVSYNVHLTLACGTAYVAKVLTKEPIKPLSKELSR